MCPPGRLVLWNLTVKEAGELRTLFWKARTFLHYERWLIICPLNLLRLGSLLLSSA